MHATKVFAAIGFDDDGGVHRGYLLGLPEIELAAISLEGHLDDV